MFFSLPPPLLLRFIFGLFVLDSLSLSRLLYYFVLLETLSTSFFWGRRCFRLERGVSLGEASVILIKVILDSRRSPFGEMTLIPWFNFTSGIGMFAFYMGDFFFFFVLG